jgi:hypothetical protein
MQPRDREQMGKAGIAHRFDDVGWNRALMTGHQRRRDRAFRLGHRRQDPLRHGMPQLRPEVRPPGRRRPGKMLAHRAIGEADRADPVEPGLALVIERAGCRRRRRREQLGQDRDAVPRRQSRQGRSDADADAVRRLLRPEPPDRKLVQQHARTFAGQRRDLHDPALHRHGPEAAVDHRRAGIRGAQLCGGEPGRNRGCD